MAIQEPLTSGLGHKLLELGLTIPNSTHPDSPVGPEDCAKILAHHGPEPLQPNHVRDHCKIGQQLDIIDFENAGVVAGASWFYLKGAAALLEHALVNYALSIAIKHGYTPLTTPDVVKADIATRCGFTPRDEPDAHGNTVHHFYHLEGPNNHVLAGTAEIPLAGMFATTMFVERELPIRVVAAGHAFRSEAGSRGAVTRGLYRVHQFTKVELFSLTEAHQSDAMLEEIRKIQTEICEGLGFPFRCVTLSSCE